MSKSNNSNQSKSSAKTVIKNVLGQVPFTAEIYWLVRHRDKKINSRFSLKRLEENLSNLCDQALNFSGEKAQQPKSIFVFATLHYWIEHAAVTGISLAAIGHEVTLGFLPYHDWQNEINKFDLRRQNLYAKDVLKKAASVLASVSLLDLHAGYKMLPDDLQERIEIITRYDTMYTLQVEGVDEQSDIYKMRSQRNLLAARAALDWFETNRPDTVVVPNGTIQEFGVVYEVARYLDIPTVTYEFGDQRNRIWIDHNQKVMMQDTDALWDAFQDRPINRSEKAKVHELFEARKKASVWKNFSRLWQHVPAKGVSIARQELGLDDRPVVLLATNVLGDSLTLGRQIFSNSMEEWLERTLQYFGGRKEIQLVIRVHPGEMLIHGKSMMGVVEKLFPALPEHIHVISPEEKVNTYDLIAASDIGLVYTTTVGLEMATSGVPVIVAGKTHYRGRGFTHDPDGWRKYYKTLKEVLDDPKAFRLTKEQISLAWDYAYRFFFDYPRPFPWHLVHLWQDYKDNPLKKVAGRSEWKIYRQVLDYLAGEQIDWNAIAESKDA